MSVGHDDMISERARVLRVIDNTAWVHCESQAGCARCAAGEGCGGGVFAKLLRGRLQELPLPMPSSLEGRLAVGDWVMVGLSTRAVQRASLLLYGLPLFALLIGAVLADAAWNHDLATLAGAATGLAAGLLVARRRSRRLAEEPSMAPVLLRKLLPSEPCPATAERGQWRKSS